MNKRSQSWRRRKRKLREAKLSRGKFLDRYLLLRVAGKEWEM